MDSQLQTTNLEGLDISKKNVIINSAADSNAEVIKNLGTLLHENGYVKDSFVQAVLDRENVFPTGLQVSSGDGVAIPHADAEHVKKSALGVAKLSNPVEFRAMGEPDKIIPVSIVMMLAIADPEKTVKVLRKVIYILENAKALQALKNAESKQDIMQIIIKHIQSLSEKV